MKNMKMKLITLKYMTVLCLLSMVVISAAALSDNAPAPNIRVSLLKYSPFPAGPGNYLTLTLRIENTGNGDADNVRLKILPDYPFSLDKNSSITILSSPTPTPLDNNMIASLGKIPAYQYTLVQYKVLVAADVPEGYRQITVWNQPYTSDAWAISAFDILIQGTDRLEVAEVVPSILTPGRPTSVMFVLNNSGTAFIHDIAFMWAEKNSKIMPLGSGNIKYVESIGAGGSAEVSFTIVADPSATSGVYNLKANITYTIGTNISKSMNVDIGMFIGGQGDFDVNVQDSQSGSVSLSIANIGANPATSVLIKIPDQQNFLVTGTSSSFIGDLNPGDFTLASFQITSRSRNFTGVPAGNPADRNFTGAPATNPTGRNFTGIPAGGSTVSSDMLSVEISYTDTNGNRQTVIKQVSMRSSSTASAITSARSSGSQFQGQSGSNSGLTYIIIGIAGVVVIILLLKYGKRIGKLIKRGKK